MNVVPQRSPAAPLASGPFRREVRQWGTVHFQVFVEESVTAVGKLWQTRHNPAEMHHLSETERRNVFVEFFFENTSKNCVGSLGAEI